MALQATFCQHASAVSIDGQAVLFLGPSGAGKSTLARRLSELSLAGLRRLADDVAPLSLARGSGAFLHTGYPQLKLADRDQPALREEALVGVGAICVLGPSLAAGANTALVRMGAADSTLALVEHSVGSRLFGPALLDGHLSFCRDLSEAVSVFELRYAWQEDATPAVAARLEQALATG